MDNDALYSEAIKASLDTFQSEQQQRRGGGASVRSTHSRRPFPDLLEVQDAQESSGPIFLVQEGHELENEKIVNRFPARITKNLPRAFCIKMTFGSFRNYRGGANGSLLHCGISDSQGKVYNFDGKGHHVDEHWPEAILCPWMMPPSAVTLTPFSMLSWHPSTRGTKAWASIMSAQDTIVMRTPWIF